MKAGTERALFDVRAWRESVGRSAEILGSGAEALAPFGFEVTGDPDWLNFP